MVRANRPMPAAVTDDECVFWIFSRTRQLNGTCADLVDMELFLHYSLIPSVSTAGEGGGGDGRGTGLLPYTSSQRGLKKSADFFDLLPYVMH